MSLIVFVTEYNTWRYLHHLGLYIFRVTTNRSFSIFHPTDPKIKENVSGVDLIYPISWYTVWYNLSSVWCDKNAVRPGQVNRSNRFQPKKPWLNWSGSMFFTAKIVLIMQQKNGFLDMCFSCLAVCIKSGWPGDSVRSATDPVFTALVIMIDFVKFIK